MALISVVISTYNRSNVLRLTIESLRAQTFTDWESIVVGDACTDDTAEVVASFGDPRIRFVNLPGNSGDQAAPNNEGVRLATGKFLAFLNHDDLWTKDHLAVALAGLGEAAADLVFTLTLSIDASGTPHLSGAAPRGVYDPRIIAPASSWLMRRSLADAVGPWHRANEILNSPSQDWLFRARRHRLVGIAKPTVIAVHSGWRKNSYADREIDVNAHYAARLRDDPELIGSLMTAVAMQLARDASDPWRIAKRVVRNTFLRVTAAVGAHPATIYHAIKFRRRGGYIDALRRVRGLPPLPKRSPRD